MIQCINSFFDFCQTDRFMFVLVVVALISLGIIIGRYWLPYVKQPKSGEQKK